MTKFIVYIKLKLHVKTNKNQRQAIQREFEPVSPTLLKNSLGAEMGYTAYVAVGGLL